MASWQQAAIDAGVLRPSLRLFLDEASAVAAFEDGACDAAWLPGRLADTHWPASASVEAFGAMPSEPSARTTLQLVMTHERSAERYLSSEAFDVAGLVLMDDLYLFLLKAPFSGRLDRSLAGQLVAVTTDLQAALVTELGGASGAVSVPLADLSEADGHFLAGRATAVMASRSEALGYQLGRRGLTLIDKPLGVTSHQLLVRKGAFDAAQLAWSRAYLRDLQAEVDEALVAPEQPLPGVARWSVDEDVHQFNESLLRDFRLRARDSGLYDADVLTLLRKMRCKYDSSRSECVNSRE